MTDVCNSETFSFLMRKSIYLRYLDVDIFDSYEDGVDYQVEFPLRTHLSLFYTEQSEKKLKIVKLLLDKGANATFVLTEACRCLDLRLVRLLIERGADVNHVSNSDGHSAITAAFGCYSSNSSQKQYKIVELLLNKGANVNTVNKDRDTLLTIACKRENLNLVRLLIERGADVNCGNVGIHGTPLSETYNLLSKLTDRKYQIVELLINKEADINAKDVFGESLVTLAFKRLNIRLVQLVIDRLTDVDLESLKHTLLITACDYYNSILHQDVKIQDLYRITKMLLIRGENINTIRNDKQSSFGNACCGVDNIETRADIDTDNERFYQVSPTAASTNTCYSNNLFIIKIVKQLLNNGANVNCVDKRGETPLTLACIGICSLQCDLDLVRLLIERGADVNPDIGSRGRTPLTIACRFGSMNFVKLLVESGANVDPDTDILGLTPLAAAFENDKNEKPQEKYEIIELLLDKGVSVNNVRRGDYLLTRACSCGDLGLVKLLIEKGADVNPHTNDVNDTPLRRACSHGDMNLVKLLVEKGADVNPDPKNLDNSPLTMACSHGDMNLVKLLIDRGADVNPCNAYVGLTPLTGAFKCKDDNNKYKIVELLLDKKANVNYVDKDGKTPITLACSLKCDLDLVRLLIERGAGLNPDIGWPGRTPLIEACRHRDINLINLLVKGGANVNANDCCLESPLNTAVEKYLFESDRSQESFEIIELLLDKGASVNNDRYGYTALSEACSWGDLRLVKLLIERGAEVNPDNCTPLTKAFGDDYKEMSKEQFEIVKLLLNAGASVNTTCSDNLFYKTTPLTLACGKGNLNLAELLIRRGAIVNPDDHDLYDTPLSVACGHGYFNIVRFLIKRGADVNPTNVGLGGTPLTAACGQYFIKMNECDHQIIELLLYQGANINTVDKYGDSPLTKACLCDNITFVELLIKKGADLNPNHDNIRQTPLTAACKKYVKMLRSDSFHESSTDIINLLLMKGANINGVNKNGKSPFVITYNSCNLKLINVLIEKGAIANSAYTTLVDTFLKENNVEQFNDLSQVQKITFQRRLKENVKKSSSDRTWEYRCFQSKSSPSGTKRKCDGDRVSETVAKKNRETVE